MAHKVLVIHERTVPAVPPFFILLLDSRQVPVLVDISREHERAKFGVLEVGKRRIRESSNMDGRLGGYGGGLSRVFHRYSVQFLRGVVPRSRANMCDGTVVKPERAAVFEKRKLNGVDS